ncbi:MAG: methyltransferase protein [Ferruginibacter sp.]|nr:methyltransferase protein [Ferruginibacter sp.]
MPNLHHRSPEKELLDADNIPFEDIRQNMQELNTVNRLLGGHAISCAGVEHFIKNSPATSTLHICEIGCGGGDNLQALYERFHQKNIKPIFTGIDIKAACVDYAREQYPALAASWLVNDYANVSFDNGRPDIIFSSLFCHHFSDEQLIFMLRWMRDNSRLGFFINDLQRHPLAYYSIKWITKIFSRSYLVKNDAPLSVARAFTKKEWMRLLQQAGIKNYTIQWKWAFRYLVIFQHEQ